MLGSNEMSARSVAPLVCATPAVPPDLGRGPPAVGACSPCAERDLRPPGPPGWGRLGQAGRADAGLSCGEVAGGCLLVMVPGWGPSTGLPGAPGQRRPRSGLGLAHLTPVSSSVKREPVHQAGQQPWRSQKGATPKQAAAPCGVLTVGTLTAPAGVMEGARGGDKGP